MKLDQELDKLRNKELKEGCVVTLKHIETVASHEFIGVSRVFCVNDSGDMFYAYHLEPNEYTLMGERQGYVQVGVKHLIDNCTLERIDGHPLTWGRLWRLFHETAETKSTTNLTPKEQVEENIEQLFVYNYELYDQNELQRMQHEKRPELKGLLKQFSDYL